MTEDSTPALRSAQSALSVYDLLLPETFMDEALIAIRQPSLAALDDGGDAGNLVDAWRATKERSRRPKSDEVWLALLLTFRSRFLDHRSGLAEALEARRMTFKRTIREIELQLSGQLFRVGRDPKYRGEEAGRGLLTDAQEMIAALWTEGFLPEHIRRKTSGMAGVSATILSRRAGEERRLNEAIHWLGRADRLGDTSPEHYGYLLEALLRRHRTSKSYADLDRAADVWKRCSTGGDRNLLSKGAELEAALARRDERNGAAGISVDRLRRSERLLTAALQLPADGEIQDGFLYSARARIRIQLASTDFRSGGRQRSEWLDLAVEDVGRAEVEPFLSDATRRRLVLAQVRRHQARREHREAAALLADLALADAPPNLLLEVSIRSDLAIAVDNSDIDRTRALIEQVLGSEELVAPATELGQGLSMLRALDAPDISALGMRIVARLESELLASSLPEPARTHVHGHAARIAWISAREQGTTEAFRRAMRLFVSAEGPDTGRLGSSLLGDAGRCALRLALAVRAEGGAVPEVVDLLRDATEWLSGALSEPTEDADVDETYLRSRLGQAYLEFHSIMGQDADLSHGISELERAQALGHPSVELVGHLADALYRRGRRFDSAEDLTRAVEIKAETRAGGDESRENRSVSASARLLLYRLTNEEAQLQEAQTAALEAAAADPRWPWPPLQLSEISAAARTAGVELQHSTGDLASRSARGDTFGLERFAAELAVATPEFERAGLGGQTNRGRIVYALDDPHRLLAKTLVLKRLDAGTAEAEIEATRSFGTYLLQSDAPPRWRLPDPLGVFEDPIDAELVVYVMRRAEGVPLGDWVLGNADREGVQTIYEDCLAFLAAFGVWGSARVSTKTLGRNRQRGMIGQISKSVNRLRVPRQAQECLAAGFGRVLGSRITAVTKKDAHCANWLVADQDLVMIDLEARTRLPVLYEVVQLVEDYPIFPADKDGWNRRLTLARMYLSELERQGLPGDLAGFEIAELYGWFVLAQAPAALNRLRKAGRETVSSSGQARALDRQAHLTALLRHLSSTGVVSDAQAYVAGALADAAEASPRRP